MRCTYLNRIHFIERPQRKRGVKKKLDILQSHLNILSNQMEIIPSRQIREDFERSFVEASEWIYKGGCGTYLRARTLKQMGEHSKTKKSPRQIRVQIINPSNPSVCKKYSDYRRAVASSNKDDLGDWSIDHVRKEAYAAVLAACISQDKYQLLKIELTLCNSISLFRYDLNPEYIIITQEDPIAPALKAKAGSHYYNSYLHELNLLFDQAIKVPLDKVKNKASENLTIEQARNIFKTLDINDNNFLTQTRLTEIITKATSPLNPYPL